MNIIPRRLFGRRQIVAFAFLASSPLVIQRTPPTKASCFGPSVLVAQSLPGAVSPRWSFAAEQARGLIGAYTTDVAQVPIKIPGVGGSKSQAEIRAESGPVFPPVFSMSSFSVTGLVKAGPIVMVYELGPESTAEVTIRTSDGKQSFVIPLPPTNGQPREVVSELPESFGKEPRVGVLSFEAFKSGSPRESAFFSLSGLGVGRNAVGSMVIDQLQFQPGAIHPKQKEKASYSFHSRSDFNTGSADFMLVTLSPDGVIRPQLVYREMLKDGVRRDKSVTRDWDGKDTKGKISLGRHQLHVRMWRGLKSGGDWVFAATKNHVRVE